MEYHTQREYTTKTGCGYNLPVPWIRQQKERENDSINHMDMASDIETIFEKWFKIDKKKLKSIVT